MGSFLIRVGEGGGGGGRALSITFFLGGGPKFEPTFFLICCLESKKTVNSMHFSD